MLSLKKNSLLGSVLIAVQHLLIMFLSALIFWLCVYCVFHSYVLYPVVLKVLAASKKNNQQVYERADDNLPQVSFVMSLYNEEGVIARKMATLLASDYPKDKLHIYIGSDASADKTNSLVAAIAQADSNIHFFPFQERRGKPSVINDLIAKAKAAHGNAPDHVIIISDANVFLEPYTIFELVKHFKNPAIGLVDSNIQNPKTAELNKTGIAASEKQYISGEVQLKHWEGKLWGCTMGPLGGCYGLRALYFEPIPPNFLVDDFYVAMKVFEQGGRAINELEAICYESVPEAIQEEFRRKTRISAGNFANLAVFKHLLWPPTSALGFTFLSHKVLRWYGPFFILIAYVSLAVLGYYYENQFYASLFILQTFGLFGIPFLDWLLKRCKINLVPIRYITYFIAMNVALFKGFLNYLKGTQNGIWQPTKRNK